MADKQTERPGLEQQLAAFEHENPKVVEAMRLFSMTMVQYQGALNAMGGPQVYQSNTTAPRNQGQHGELE